MPLPFLSMSNKYQAQTVGGGALDAPAVKQYGFYTHFGESATIPNRPSWAPAPANRLFDTLVKGRFTSHRLPLGEACAAWAMKREFI